MEWEYIGVKLSINPILSILIRSKLTMALGYTDALMVLIGCVATWRLIITDGILIPSHLGSSLNPCQPVRETSYANWLATLTVQLCAIEVREAQIRHLVNLIHHLGWRNIIYNLKHRVLCFALGVHDQSGGVIPSCTISKTTGFCIIRPSTHVVLMNSFNQDHVKQNLHTL